MGIPDGAEELDELQREGAASLLDKGLESVEAIEGADGVEVEVTDCFVGAHAEGVLLGVSVDAPALEFAEDAVRAVVTELLEQNEPLAEWRISKCAVELHPELAQRSLEAAGGDDAPPADPEERARRHAEARKPAEPTGFDPAEVEAMRATLRGLAPRLQAFSVECSDTPTTMRTGSSAERMQNSPLAPSAPRCDCASARRSHVARIWHADLR